MYEVLTANKWLYPWLIKRDFFQTIPMSVLMYGSTIWILTKHVERKLWELHQNAACCGQQILEEANNKTAAVQPLTSHLSSFQNMQDLIGAAGKLATFFYGDLYTDIQCWLIIKDFHLSALLGLWMLSRGLTQGDDRESKENPCNWKAWMKQKEIKVKLKMIFYEVYILQWKFLWNLVEVNFIDIMERMKRIIPFLKTTSFYLFIYLFKVCKFQL